MISGCNQISSKMAEISLRKIINLRTEYDTLKQIYILDVNI